MRTKEEVTRELMATIDKANHLRLELVAIECGLEGFEAPGAEELEQAAELTDELTAFLPPAPYVRPMGVPVDADLTPGEQAVVRHLHQQIDDALAARSVAERARIAVNALSPKVA